MKKLLIVAAIAATASFAHAGAYTWGFGSSADAAPGQIPDESTGDGYLTGGTAMLFLGTLAQTATGEGSGIDAKYTLDFTGLTHIATAAQDDITYAFGQMDFDSSVTDDAIDTTTPQAFTLILFEDSGVTDYENYEGYYFAQTGESVLATDPASSTRYAKFMKSDAVSGDSWATATVAPEPTSGLLMLMGLAGLALRRKRA